MLQTHSLTYIVQIFKKKYKANKRVTADSMNSFPSFIQLSVLILLLIRKLSNIFHPFQNAQWKGIPFNRGSLVQGESGFHL